MKHLSFFVSVTIFLVLIAVLGYFVAINTILKNTPLISHSFTAQVAGASDQRDILEVNVEGNVYQVPLEALQLNVDESKLHSFGKGADFTKVLQDGITILTNQQNTIQYQLYTLNYNNLFSGAPIALSSTEGILHAASEVTDCNTKRIKVAFDTELINKKVLEAVQNRTPLIISYTEVGVTTQQMQILSACRKLLQMQEDLRTALKQENLNIENFLKIQLQPNQTERFEISNEDAAYIAINTARFMWYTPPKEGQYKETEDVVLLLSSQQNGIDVDVNASVTALKKWIANPTDNFSLVFLDIYPSTAFIGKPIKDFTNIIATGSTRLDLYVDGLPNPGIYFAELGLAEIDYAIVQPGEEFSFLKKIDKQPGLNITASGRLIGYGYCNSTTTLFRAALEAGFPITDRSYHWFNVPSYDWGYELNVVDAAFYAVPGQEVDLKFINDLNTEVLLRVTTDTKDGYQYHNVQIRSASSAPNREVVLYDFHKTADYGQRKFDGLFRRKVTIGSSVVREDEFRSLYR